MFKTDAPNDGAALRVVNENIEKKYYDGTVAGIINSSVILIIGKWSIFRSFFVFMEMFMIRCNKY